MRQSAFAPNSSKTKYLWVLLLSSAILTGWASARAGILVPGALLGLSFIAAFVVAIFYQPKWGLLIYIAYSFFPGIIDREISVDLSFHNLAFGLIGLSWLSAKIKNSDQFQWSNIKNDLCFLGLIWVFINFLQLVNPVAGSILGWISEVKYPFLWIFLTPLCMVLLNKKKDLDFFLILIISASLLAAFYGVKQLKVGLTAGEEAYLAAGAHKTHILFGKLRVFSFYSNAGQFGSSMAHLCVISLVLALGPFKIWKKILCAIASLIFLYGMMISGTRGALFTLFVGAFIFLVLTKNFKVMVLGGLIAFAAFFFLKYTYIGHDVYEIRRMRTALNPEDASLHVRLENQARLAQYLKSYPFGAGLGSIGFAGKTYNGETFLSSIPPDSYWVKVWAQYGIVGLIIWMGMMMYLIGKACGIIWNTHDRGLKYKLIALTAGAAGIFICSYGNEIMNSKPSSIILYVSWAFMFLGPKLDRKKTQTLE